MTEFKKYRNKETGEIVTAEKDIVSDHTTLSRQTGYWVNSQKRTDFLAEIYFNQQYQLIENERTNKDRIKLSRAIGLTQACISIDNGLEFDVRGLLLNLKEIEELLTEIMNENDE